MHYASLQKELQIGEIFLRLLLEQQGGEVTLHEPAPFFNELYMRLLREVSHPRAIGVRVIGSA